MIEFIDVSFSYDKKGITVLNNLTFKIEKGEFVAFVGKNGAGKTTLLKHINGLLRPTIGEVKIEDEDIVKKPLSEMAMTVGLAFQNPNHQLFAETVMKELEFGPKNLGSDPNEIEEKIQEIAEHFGITHLLERNPLELSGGEGRLVSIASVLTMNQSILVLDEPTFGQDYRQKKRLGHFLKSLSEKGITVIVVSHDLNFILDFAQRIIVLSHGEIIKDESAFDVFSDETLLEKSDLAQPVLLNLATNLRKRFDEFPLSYNSMELVENLKQILQKGEK
ncbi:MAG: ATP-binding cassette domain-containing protein [Candidatus Heimdallarchaeota archaeon]|nr:ATP-binding cassette domain-containing protein [Candidatus Heimdallarchaeota archaeon]MCK4290949.1 ATP-binding cassette domain-containing protein [Candidatus Heimdallarchaeota archaeon]